MKHITLPPKELLLTLLEYNPATGSLTWKRREERSYRDKSWNSKYASKPALNSVGAGGYLRGAIGKVNYQAHRTIWKIMTGEDPEEVDHINGVRTDNRWENLRSVPRFQNMRNQKKRRDNTSGFTGVFWNPQAQKWRATIKDNGKSKHLGQFTDLAQAAQARKQAEQALGYHTNHGR